MMQDHDRKPTLTTIQTSPGDPSTDGTSTLAERVRPYQSLVWPITLLALVLAGWLFLAIARGGKSPPPAPIPPRPPRLSENYFDATVAPLAQENAGLNRAAAERCVESVRAHFATYRAGVRPFAEDMTSLGTKFKILAKMPSDWWNSQNNVTAFVRQRFEARIFNESRLQSDLSTALDTFRQDIRANQNALLVKVKAAVSQSELPDFPLPDYEAFNKQVVDDMARFTAGKAVDSVYSGIAALVASEVAANLGSQVVVRMMPLIATTAAAEAALGGSVTVATTTGGGTGGAALGPVGVAVGMGVGLLVGVAVEWWMNESFKAKLITQIDDYLMNIQNNLLTGTKTRDGREQEGLVQALDAICGDLEASEDAVLRRAILGESP